MSPKEKKTKRWGEEPLNTPASVVKSGKGVSVNEKPQIPYKLKQICVDVKIVDIRPDNERCIGFVYAKRDGNGGLIKERGAKTLESVWSGEVSYMTLSDFESFIESRKKCYTL